MITSETEQNSALQGLDLTPLIDIIFIVLVFLLLTANTQLLSLPVDVPTEADASLSALSHDKHIAINILTTEPHWAIDGTTYQSFDEFEAEFIKIFGTDPEVKVVVAADKTAPVQPLMNVLALLQRQQISNTQILMEP
ncbi:Biopolymer transport protein ExbD/TolR [Shewanella piezotolerans WP3]|uniref:Biopolymer transport protein ExbD/TolR n=1 Tax=Shewanella piezotolerans (strain WP3 / JCM 13877) TaxID=225849 RepID=B8CSM5_SHEPW|nr:biopolymer transporter ExbD [Shewanella piezotolerans]ACJ30651.1 Biopolymer transport protein ExbD/TolR [Shewanella piezotolerans WP3]